MCENGFLFTLKIHFQGNIAVFVVTATKIEINIIRYIKEVQVTKTQKWYCDNNETVGEKTRNRKEPTRLSHANRFLQLILLIL